VGDLGLSLCGGGAGEGPLRGVGRAPLGAAGRRGGGRSRAAKVAAAAALAALLGPRPAAAQLADSLAGVSVESYPWARDLDDGRRQARVNIVRMNVGLPVRLSERTLLLTGLTYEHINTDLRGGEPGTPSPVFHAPALSLGLVQKVGARWACIGIFGAGLASDFSQPASMADFFVNAIGIVTYRVSDAFSIGGGAVYDQRTGLPRPLPALNLNWRVNQDVRVRGVVPSRLDFEVRANRWVVGGLRAALNGNRYRLGERRYGEDDLRLAYSTLTVGPKLTLNAGEWVHLDLYAAAAVYRRYEVFHDGDKANSVSLAPVVGYGIRFWIGPSMWDGPPKR
jgi:Domain of unknown function (DUF6268)